MNTALGVLIGSAMLFVCVLAVWLNPGFSVLVALLAVLAGIYALRSVGGKAARARRKRRLEEKS